MTTPTPAPIRVAGLTLTPRGVLVGNVIAFLVLTAGAWAPLLIGA